MGSSAVDFKEVFFWSSDGILEYWVAFLVQEIDRLPKVPGWLADARAQGYEQATNNLVGTHWLGLNEIITTVARKKLVLSLAHTALDTVRLHDDMVVTPDERLPDMAVGGDPHWAEDGLSATKIMHVGAAFIALLLHVPMPAERQARAVAVVTENYPGFPTAVRLHPRDGQLNIGAARLLVATGQAYEVRIEWSSYSTGKRWVITPPQLGPVSSPVSTARQRIFKYRAHFLCRAAVPYGAADGPVANSSAVTPRTF